MTKEVKCPQCGKPVIWNKDNPFRPFCSERCKMLDLGAWAMEKHYIPGEPAPEEGGESSSNDTDSSNM